MRRADHVTAAAQSRRRVLATTGVALLAWSGWPQALGADSILDRATVQVRYRSGSACEARLAYVVSTTPGTTIEHRLRVDDGVGVSNVRLSSEGHGPVEPMVEPRGRAWRLLVPIGASGARYELRYDVEKAGGLDGRCPIWVPLAATRGADREVTLHVEAPAGWTVGPDAFPALRWEDGLGRASLAHVPAFVHASFTPSGSPAPLWQRVGMHQAVDLSAVGVLLAATAWWAWSRRSR